MEDINSVFSSLFSKRKLERDQGVKQLSEYLNNTNAHNVHIIEELLLKPFKITESEWESRHGALLGAKALIMRLKELNVDNKSEIFLEDVYKYCLEYLTDTEVRIRLAAGETLGSLCYLKGPEVYGHCNGYVLQLIKDNLERDSMETSSVFASDSGDEQSSPEPKGRVRVMINFEFFSFATGSE
ncbi:uncharacterized protein LOC118203577, partial [Stegodyphus dumicola]|uniref:uncharacterized protein LOC118203577 n=1 Tax=Stegodyphus dumicola TaxID=202533 RepID=UPI0015A9A2E3